MLRDQFRRGPGGILWCVDIVRGKHLTNCRTHMDWIEGGATSGASFPPKVLGWIPKVGYMEVLLSPFLGAPQDCLSCLPPLHRVQAAVAAPEGLPCIEHLSLHDVAGPLQGAGLEVSPSTCSA